MDFSRLWIENGKIKNEYEAEREFDSRMYIAGVVILWNELHCEIKCENNLPLQVECVFSNENILFKDSGLKNDHVIILDTAQKELECGHSKLLFNTDHRGSVSNFAEKHYNFLYSHAIQRIPFSLDAKLACPIQRKSVYIVFKCY